MRDVLAVPIFSAMRSAGLLLVLGGMTILAGSSGCDRKSADRKAPPPQAIPSAKIEKKEPLPWFVGKTEARVAVVGLSNALALDEADRRRAQGKEPDPLDEAAGGTLELRIEVEGDKQVSGMVRFGEATAEVRGRADGDSLRFRWSSPSLNGYGVAHKREGAWKGKISYSVAQGDDAALETRAYTGELELPLPKPPESGAER